MLSVSTEQWCPSECTSTVFLSELTLYSRYSEHGFQVVGDSKVSEYSYFLFMTVALLLRHIHAILKESASDYGPFKIRGVKPQFEAALALYHLFLTTGGDDLDPEADWAIHNLFQTLLCPKGFNDRAINYPTDQAIFLWAFLSDHKYRISSHLQSLMSAAKYCLRCISLQIARIQVQGDLDSPFFETISNSGTDMEDDRDNGDVHASSDEEMVIVEIPGEKIDTGEVLEWLNTRLNRLRNDGEGNRMLTYERPRINKKLLAARAFDTSTPSEIDERPVVPERNLYEYAEHFKFWYILMVM